MWSAFYQFRAADLFMWKQLIMKLKMPEKFEDAWLPQTVARLALESIIKPSSLLPHLHLLHNYSWMVMN